MTCEQQIKEVFKTGGKVYKWEELHNMKEIPCDLDAVQRACITLTRIIINTAGDVSSLVSTGVVSVGDTKRIDNIIGELQNHVEAFLRGLPTERGEILYNILTEDEKRKLREYTMKMLEGDK